MLATAAADSRTTHTTAARSLDGLALRAQRGADGAEAELLEALLNRLRPLVGHRVLTRGRGALAEADIDDLLQEIVLLVWKQDLPRFDPSRSGFLTFVSRRVQWHLADRMRSARRHAPVELDDTELCEVAAPGTDPESLLLAHQHEIAMRDLERIVDAAPVDRTAHDVLIRHDLQGATLAEVARELDIHVSNACRARQRGLRHLARHLEAIA